MLHIGSWKTKNGRQLKPPPDEIDAVFALLMQGDPLLIAMNGAARADKK